MSEPKKLLQDEINLELVEQTTQAIVTVRLLVSRLNEREKAYLQNNSVEYRQLVNTIAAWIKSQ